MGEYAPNCKCRQSKVNLQPCPLHEPQKLISLNISNEGYTGCMGMERFKNLLSLTLVFNKLSEVSFVAHLPQLKLLNVQHNQIASLQGLVGDGQRNTSLLTLKVSHNNLKSLAEVSRCPNIEELWSSHNLFASVAVVEDLSGLTKLSRIVFSPNKCCAADPGLYIVGHVPSVTVVDGNVITQAVRDKARDYVAKGFAPPPAPSTKASESHDHVVSEGGVHLPLITGPERRDNRSSPASQRDFSSSPSASPAPEVASGGVLASIMDCLPDLSSFGSAAKVANPTRKPRGEKRRSKQSSGRRASAQISVHSGQRSRPASSGSMSGPSSRRPSTADKQEGDAQQTTDANPNSKHKTKSQSKSQPRSQPKIKSKIKSKPNPKSHPKGARQPDSVPSPAVPIAQSELRLYYTKKKKVLAILIRSNGTAVAKWPNNKIAVSVDYNGSGWSMFAAHHGAFNSAIALNFDFFGAGFVNHPPPCASMMLSVAADGSGMLMNERCEMQTRWASESAPYVDIGGGDPRASHSKWCVDRELSKHLGVRFGRAGSALEVFFKCKGIHFKFVRGYNHSASGECGKQPAGLSLMGTVQVRKKKKKAALTHGQRISSIRSAVSGL